MSYARSPRPEVSITMGTMPKSVPREGMSLSEEWLLYMAVSLANEMNDVPKIYC
jgi:hypothetical protein